MLGRQVSFNETQEILSQGGIPILGRSVLTVEDACAIAAEVGFPVAMKLISPDVIHKTDAGVVLLDIPDCKGVHEAWTILMARGVAAGAKVIDGVLVQPMARRGFEVLVGARQDPVFGPVTMIGHGGRFVELFKDVAPGVGALTACEVEKMLAQTLAGQVVEGFRGAPLDKAALVDLTVKVAALMMSRPDVNELDLNPVILYEQGYSLVDVRLILGEPIYHPRMEDLSAERLASLERIFSAKSVAVVGASRPGSVGGVILKNSSGVERVYPINPTRDTLLGFKCYPDLSALPEVPDVAVFAVRPEHTVSGLQTFFEMGGQGAIIVSDGFAEIGRNDLEQELVDLSQAHGKVYIGPNGLGIFDNYSGLNTLFLPRHRTAFPSRPGPVGIISQSGGVGMELLEMVTADNLPVGKFVSMGNASGVSIPELLKHMGDDPRVLIIAMYMEGLRNGLQFLEVARQVARKKPILLIKGGMAGGAAATMSHTASLAGSFQAFKAACYQAGVYVLEELTEDPKFLTNILSMLTTQRPARGNRAAVVSVGGGAAILLADQLTSQGMVLTEFSEDSKRQIGELLMDRLHLPTEEERAKVAARLGANPLDLFGDASDERLLAALRILNQDDNVDLIVMALYLQPPYLTEYLPERLAELQGELTKPLIMSLRGYSPYVRRIREQMVELDTPTYTVPVIKSLKVAVDIWTRYGIDFSA